MHNYFFKLKIASTFNGLFYFSIANKSATNVILKEGNAQINYLFLIFGIRGTKI